MVNLRIKLSGLITSLFFIGLYLLPKSSIGATPNSLDKILQLPSQYGTLKESFDAQAGNQNREQTIIYVQDAHCNYEAQKNMAQLLEYLIKEHSLRLIMVEGGSGDVGLEFLRPYSDKKTRQEVADKYLRMGKISGEEYLDIVSDYSIELYGIEDNMLYDANLDSFLRLQGYREEGLKNIENLISLIGVLKPYIYNARLLEFEEKRNAYEQKSISLAEYCQYLKELVDRMGLDLIAYPHILAFVETAKLEKEIDFKIAELQRNTFIKELAKLLDENKLKELLNNSEDFKSGKMKPNKYYTFLSSLSENRVDIRKDYPQLASYINYVNSSQEVNVSDLLGEINSLEDKLKDGLFVNDDERRLVEISKSSTLLNKFLKLDLTPQEYEYFKENQASFLTASWTNFLNNNCQKYNISMQPYDSSAIDENFDKLEEFYQSGITREGAFINNIVKKMDETGERIAVLITGGFHTPGIVRMLKDEGYSYVVIAPLITKKGDSDIYFSVLREGKNNVTEEFLSDEE